MGRSRFANLFLLPGTLWLLALFVVPLGIVVAVALATPDVVNRPVYGWNPGNIAEVVGEPLYLKLFGRSLLFAGGTMLICLVLGYTVAYTIARYGGHRRLLLVGLVLMPWLVDYLVRIYAWVVILGNEGLINGLLGKLGMEGSPPLQLTNTPWAVLAGLTYTYFPLMVMPLYAALESLDPSLIEAGKDLYGTPRATFLHVTLPATTEGIMAGCLLTFLPAMGDFATAQLLGGVGTYMMGNLIADQFQAQGDWPFGAAVTLVMMTFMWLVIIVFMTTRGRRAISVGAS